MAESERPLPAPVLPEHEYSYAIVLELRRLNANVEALAAAMSNPPPSGEVALREPARHRDARQEEAKRAVTRPEVTPRAEPLSMVEPEPQNDPLSLVEVGFDALPAADSSASSLPSGQTSKESDSEPSSKTSARKH